VNIFDTFLPQLLTYPNPADPLNPEAAQVLDRSTHEFNERVKEYVKLYSNPSPEGPPKPDGPVKRFRSEKSVDMNSSEVGSIESLNLDDDSSVAGS
jgi:ubiquitin-conjugating enzyme E2 H